MHAFSHLAYPYIVFNLLALIFGKTIPLEYNIAFLVFSMFPDYDYAIDFLRKIFKQRKYTIPANHHAWPSHWPIVYTPLFVISLITMEPFFLIASAAIAIHLFMDIFLCNQGIMIFYPFSKKWYNFFSEKTRGKPGLEWNKVYNELRIHFYDKSALFIASIHFMTMYVVLPIIR